MSKTMRLWAAAGIILLAFGLRVWLLADFNVNWDEGYSVWISRLPLPTLMDTTARDVHPPAYYLALRGFRAVAGEGEFIWRFVSVAFGVLAVALTARLGQAVGGAHVGLAAALLVAVSRSHIHISQLARMHVLAALLATGALWAAAVLFARPQSRRAALAYVLCTAGALYTFYLAVMLPLAVNAAFLVIWGRRWLAGERRPRQLWTWVGLQVAAAALFAPWAVYASARMFGWSSSAATPPLFFTAFYASTLTVGRPTFDAAQLPAVFAYLGVVAAGLAALLWTLRRSRNGQAVDHLLLLLAGVLTPAVVVFLLSLPFHDLGRPLAARYMLPLAACFYVLAAWGILTLGRWRPAAGGLALALTVGVAGWGLSNIADGAVRRDELHSVALMLDAMRREGDAVLLHNDRTWTTLAAHYDGPFQRVPQAETMTESYAETILNPLRVNHAGVWLVTTPHASANDPTGIIEAWLYRNSMLTQTWTFNDHTLGFYTYAPGRSETFNTLAPGIAAPPRHANEALGLAGARVPVRRVPVGDALFAALYWDAPPSVPVELALSGAGEGAASVIEPPTAAADGLTRGVASVAVPPETAAGRYRLILRADDVTHDLGAVEVVAARPAEAVAVDEIAQRVNTDLRRANETDALLTLLGYDAPDTVWGGGALDVALYWQAAQTIPQRYKVSVYLLGDAINPATGTPLYAQVDAEPVDWTLPTTLWRVGEPIRDPYTLSVAADVPPGSYTLGVVVYNPTTGDRLFTPDGADNIRLQTVTVR